LKHAGLAKGLISGTREGKSIDQLNEIITYDNNLQV